MMKLYKSISAALMGLAITASSCVDLKQEPLSFYTMENFKPEPASFESLANGLYQNFAYGNVTGNNYGFNCRIIALNVGADDIVDGKKSVQRLTHIDQLNIQDNSGGDIAQMWNMMYKAVQAGSYLVRNVLAKEIPANVMKEVYANDTLRLEEEFNAAKCKELTAGGWLNEGKKLDIRSYLGEAYFVRALSYFYLVRFWGDVPCYANQMNTKSVDGTAAISQQVPRTKIKDIYTKMIIRDLLLAIELLPANSRTENNATANLWSAKIALADVYLTMAGYPLKETARYADCYNLCLDIKNNGPYSLANKYSDLWKESKKTDNQEHIFSIIHANKNGLYSNYGMSYFATEENVGGEGWSDYLMDPYFYRSFPDDSRLKAIAVTEFENEYVEGGKKMIRMLPYTKASKKSPAIAKYRDYGGKSSPQSLGITPIYRYAQVLLMLAESSVKYKKAVEPVALEALREIRRRAGYTVQIMDDIKVDELEKLIFEEYGWEFFCEGKRWFQLVRTEKVIEMNQNNKEIKNVLTANGLTSEAAAQTGKGYLMPIFNSAIEDAKNVGVVITQNPGY